MCSETCEPPCNNNETCVNGVCVNSCTPPCNSNETCVNGVCVSNNNSCEPPCSNGEICNSNNTCVCLSNPCKKTDACGTDGCGNSCGSCPQGYTCNSSTRTCVCSVNPCEKTDTCGTDGCGNSCGSCQPGYTCDNQTRTCIGPVSFNIFYTQNNTQYILSMTTSYPPTNLMFIPYNTYKLNPTAFLTNWVYDPNLNTIVLAPRVGDGWKIYALVAGPQASGNTMCDPYPAVNGALYPSNSFAQRFGDYGIYVDLYDTETIAQYGKQRFQRWEIFSNGVIQDNSCSGNNGQGARCIAVYMYQGQPVMTTTSPWELNCTQFSFSPMPPNGTFSNGQPIGTVLSCPIRTGTQSGCPKISVNVEGNANPVYGNQYSPVCGNTTNPIIAAPHPNWGSIVAEFGEDVCGVNPDNNAYQQGCCNYLGDSCFNTANSTWCNKIAPPNQ